MVIDVKKETRKLKNLVSKYHRVTAELGLKLEKMGYEKCILGTGKQSHASSKMINIWELDNTFIKGRYIGVGCANRIYGKGHQYIAYVKKLD